MFDNKIFDNSGGGGALTPVVPSPAGNDTYVQFNDGGAMGADAQMTFTKTTGILTLGDGTNPAALYLNGPGRAADGRNIYINNTGATGVCALEISAHAGGTAGYGIIMSAIYPLRITNAGSDYAITAANHPNDNGGGMQLSVGLGDQAVSQHILSLRRFGTGAFTGNAICMLYDRSDTGAGEAGQDNDVLGTISFKGYNAAASPELVEFAYIEAGIAASGTVDDLERGFLSLWAKADYDDGSSHPSLKIHQPTNYFVTYDFLGATGLSGNKGPFIRTQCPNNTGACLQLDSAGGDSTFYWTTSNSTEQWRFFLDFDNANLEIYDASAGGIGSVMSFHKTEGNINFWRSTTATQPTSGVKNLVFGNGATAPSAILADSVVAWCADYVAGDARLSIMGEKNTNTLTLGAGNVLLRPDTMADDSVSGETFVGTAGEDLAWGDVVYMAADGKFYKADADSSSTAPAVAFCTATISADASGEFLKRGWIRDDSAYNFTKGPGASGLIYLSTDAGAVTQTAPSGTGDQVQVLGWAYTADIWYFEPQLVVVEV